MNLHKITYILLIIGGLNWLLVGLIGWDVGQLFGGMAAPISRIIYVLVLFSQISLQGLRRTRPDVILTKTLPTGSVFVFDK